MHGQAAVIVQSEKYGAVFGKLKPMTDLKSKTQILYDARMLWKWQTKKGVTLFDVAIYGLDPKLSILSDAVKEIVIHDVMLIVKCSAEAEQDIEEFVTDVALTSPIEEVSPPKNE